MAYARCLTTPRSCMCSHMFCQSRRVGAGAMGAPWGTMGVPLRCRGHKTEGPHLREGLQEDVAVRSGPQGAIDVVCFEVQARKVSAAHLSGLCAVTSRVSILQRRRM